MSDESGDLTGRMDRRGFLGNGAGAFAAAGALVDDKAGDQRPRVRRRKARGGLVNGPPSINPGGVAGQEGAAQAANQANQDQAVELPTRKLGRTGVDVTMLSVGT